jgi:hypothetical protein
MNSLERTLIEKAGYDNGWEVVVKSVPEYVILASALHKAQARITLSEQSRWKLDLPIGLLTSELNRETSKDEPQGPFHASNDTELGALLNRAAKLARSLPNLPEVRFAEAVKKALSETDTSKTEVERLVRQRVGQDIYRQSLMDYWGGACAVTGIKHPELLRASHAKGWSECDNDADRLNVFNGFLLCAHLDALFDRHLMTFDESGAAIFSSRLSTEDLATLALTPTLKLRWITPEHEAFLTIHRSKFLNHE